MTTAAAAAPTAAVATAGGAAGDLASPACALSSRDVSSPPLPVVAASAAGVAGGGAWFPWAQLPGALASALHAFLNLTEHFRFAACSRRLLELGSLPASWPDFVSLSASLCRSASDPLPPSFARLRPRSLQFGPRPTPERLEVLARMRSLRTLALLAPTPAPSTPWHAPFDLSLLASFPPLASLYLADAWHLPPLDAFAASLHTLTLHNTDLRSCDSSSLAPLHALHSLTDLDVFGCYHSAASVRALFDPAAGCTFAAELRALRLDSGGDTRGDTFRHLSLLSSLTYLNLRANRSARDAGVVLPSLPSLEHLVLTRFGGPVPPLAPLYPRLQHLALESAVRLPSVVAGLVCLEILDLNACGRDNAVHGELRAFAVWLASGSGSGGCSSSTLAPFTPKNIREWGFTVGSRGMSDKDVEAVARAILEVERRGELKTAATPAARAETGIAGDDVGGARPRALRSIVVASYTAARDRPLQERLQQAGVTLLSR